MTDLLMIFRHNMGDRTGEYFDGIKSMDISFPGHLSGRMTWKESGIMKLYEKQPKIGKGYNGIICAKFVDLKLGRTDFPDALLENSPVITIDLMEEEPRNALLYDPRFVPDFDFVLTQFTVNGKNGERTIPVRMVPGPDFEIRAVGDAVENRNKIF